MTSMLPFLLALLTLLPATESAVRSLLTLQQDAWNRGDLDTFVSTYSDDCVFVGSETVKGRNRVLQRYRTRYPDAAHMGRLTFSAVEVNQVDARVATVLGKFHLDRAKEAGGPANGVFSLVVRERSGRWLIVLDHTS